MTLDEYVEPDVPVIGALPPRELAETLEELGDQEAAAQVREALKKYDDGLEPRTDFGLSWPQILGGPPPPWQYTAHAFGYIKSLPPGTTEPVPIKDASNIPHDRALIGSSVAITLQQLRVAKYPGKGRHQILLDCGVFDRRLTSGRELRFSRSYSALDGHAAGVNGDPLFVGLQIADTGIGLRCVTVNVKNEVDEEFLQVLNSGTFRHGLKLAGAALNPAIVPLTEIVAATTSAFIRRKRRNVKVQDFRMSLDFQPPPLGARLAMGSYVAVQIPQDLELAFDWSEFVYLPDKAAIVSSVDKKTLINHNYLVFGIQPFA